LVAACALAAAAMAAPLHAANWLMIEGTEPPDVTHRFFGAVQINYENNFGCKNIEGLVDVGSQQFSLNNGVVINHCRVGPELRNKDSGFFMPTLMGGVRGNLIPGRVNYFLAVNAGQNLANYKPFKTDREYLATLTDASMTFSYIPGARVRIGRFKKPGPEELMQGLDANDYVFLTDYTARVQIERFVESNAKGINAIPGQGYAANIKKYADDADVGRDTGVQFFDAFRLGKWTNSYSVMISMGEGVHGFDLSDSWDRTLYLSSEYDLPGGKGPLKHGVKLYAYHQRGERNFLIDAAGTKSEDFDKIRYGFGIKALGPIFGENNGKHRLGFEVMFADGMVHYTPVSSVTDGPFGGQMNIAAERGNMARGITVDYGYYYNKHWQYDIRFSRNSLLYRQDGTRWIAADERELDFLTLGFNYHFTPDTRVTFDYEFRDVTAPVPHSNPAVAANQVATTSSVGDRIGVRLTHKF
jgi:hypothetical protein